MKRGEIWWVDFGVPQGSEAGYRHPAIVERIMEIAGEEFTLEKFYSNDSDAFGSQTKAGFAMPFDRTFGVDPKWSRGSEKGSVVYMGEHPDYSKIK